MAWNSNRLIANLCAVLERRLMDSSRLGCERLPLASKRSASIEAISSFIHGEVDDERISELLRGMILVDQWKPLPNLPFRSSVDTPPLPRAFALLKLLFLPHSILRASGEIEVRPEASILPLLRAGRTGEFCAIAARRLRSSGLVPMPHARGVNRDAEWRDALGSMNPTRLAAALLIPVSRKDIDRLVKLIARPEQESQQAAF